MLFKGYLDGNTKIEIRCPRCGIVCRYPANKNGHDTEYTGVLDPNNYTLQELEKIVEAKPRGNSFANTIAMIEKETAGKNRKSVLKLLNEWR
jgi:hypothetical protein